MANNLEYLTTLQMVIRDLHGCGSKHVETVGVLEVFRGETVWQGQVEVFELSGHPKAKRCYAWGHAEGQNGERFVAVLEIPPVVSAETAVRASIISERKRA